MWDSTHQSLQSPITVVHEIIIKPHHPRLKQTQQRRSTELEVTQLLSPLDAITRLPRDDSATDHHGTNANDHHTTVHLAIDRYTDADILAVDVERRANGHGVDGVVLAIDELGLPHDAVDGNVEAVVVLWGQSHDAQTAVLVALGVVGVGIAEEAFHREFAAFDPDALSVFHAVEDDGAAVGGRDDDVWVIRSRARASFGLELAVEELVEGLEGFCRVEDFAHIELVEVDEARDLGGAGWIVVFAALFKGQRTQQFPN